RVFFHAEKVGYMLTWLSGPVPVFAAGLLSGVLLMIAFRPHGGRDDSAAAPGVRQGGGPDPESRSVQPPDGADSPSPPRDSPSRRLPPLVLLPAVLVLATVPAPQARAADTDSAVATSGAFSSRAEFLPRADQPFGSGA